MRYLWLHLKQLGLLLCLIMLVNGCSQPLKNHQVRQVKDFLFTDKISDFTSYSPHRAVNSR